MGVSDGRGGRLAADEPGRSPLGLQDAIREHVRIFVNRERVVGLDAKLVSSDEVQILQALSGG